MSNATNKPIRSPSYPIMPLRDAIDAVSKIERQYRTSPVDRSDAAKLIGYSVLSGPAAKALAALASYGLVDRAGKGELRVTERVRAILYAHSDRERKENLLKAAFEPPLFRELHDRFDGVPVPPEDGVVSYLNRQGFNPTAVRPAAKAFLQTMAYLKEAGASDSGGARQSESEASESSGDDTSEKYGDARVGDLIQWVSGGTLQFAAPLRVRHITDDADWVFVEDSETGIPMDEVIVQESSVGLAQSARTPPRFPLPQAEQSERVRTEEGETEWMRNRVGMDTNVRLLVKGEMGPKEIKRLIRLLEAQRAVLMDEDDEVG